MYKQSDHILQNTKNIFYLLLSVAKGIFYKEPWDTIHITQPKKDYLNYI
jgi:hypothetical protein